MYTIQRPRTRQPTQAGMVSIIVTLILMMVITLIVLGFATVSRREQRTSQDRQLSTQAFFAAESGINDAREVIIQKVATGQPIPEKTDCAPDANYNGLGLNSPSNKLKSDNSVSYPCLLVTTKLDNLTVNPVVAGGRSTVLPLEPVGVMTNLRINWKTTTTPAPNSNAINKCNGNPTNKAAFPRNNISEWKCPYGVMRLDIVPTASLNRTTLSAAQKTMFLYPTNNSSGATQTYGTSNGAVARMKCIAGADCTIDITGMPPGAFMMRVSGIYVNGVATITAQNNAGNDLDLQNAQILVDVTGKAENVLRRVQVRLPLANATAPNYAIASGSSICKRFEASPVEFVIPAIVDQDLNNPMCKQTTVADSGDAIFETGCSLLPEGCDPNDNIYDPNAKANYGVNIVNRSTNPPGEVRNCIWNFGYTATASADPPTSNTGCFAGDTFNHKFPYRGETCADVLARDGGKKPYPVTLTINFNNGLAPRTYSRNVPVPANCHFPA